MLTRMGSSKKKLPKLRIRKNDCKIHILTLQKLPLIFKTNFLSKCNVSFNFRNSTRNSSRNSTLQFEVDDEVSINPAPIKRTSKKLSKLQEESTDKINDSKVKKQSVVEEPSILEDDDESSEGETLDESVLIQQDVTKDIVKKSAFNETTVHDPETGDEDSGDDSMSESGSLEKEIV